MPVSLSIAFMLIGSSVLSAFLALYLLALVQNRQLQGRAGLPGTSEADTVFLFNDQVLVDASDRAHDFLASSSVGGSPWVKLCELLEPDFPGFEQKLRALEKDRRLTLMGHQNLSFGLIAEWRSGLIRIVLADAKITGQVVSMDGLSFRAMEQELRSLRRTLDQSPVLTWREGKDGAITWANRAYLECAAHLFNEASAPTWPLPKLFIRDLIALVRPAPLSDEPGYCGRVTLALPNEKQARWFDRFEFADKDGTLQFATSADRAVQAESSLKEFVQTLTKTFAHLPIGLAIFDRQRQLALFNPALIDLTGLAADFLSAQPSLFGLLDRLRENRRVPEPKNYKQWREQMAALEAAASSGQYEQTWSLPNGQTYRVIGRPHPDGALALLFEDITAAVSLTRRFRGELELGQSVIDGMPEAIAVFSIGGILVLSNAAYAKLWGIDPSTALGQVGISEAAEVWLKAVQAGPTWARLREMISSIGEREDWSGESHLLDGRLLQIRATPLHGGATLVGFTATARSTGTIPGRRRGSSQRSAKVSAIEVV